MGRLDGDVWGKDVWDFQARSGSSGSCPLLLHHLLGKVAVLKKSGNHQEVPDLLPPTSGMNIIPKRCCFSWEMPCQSSFESATCIVRIFVAIAQAPTLVTVKRSPICGGAQAFRNSQNLDGVPSLLSCMICSKLTRHDKK